MSCLTALHSQIVTFLSVPHEILFLQHKVFREYAKIAVGPDFIHTFPSFLILGAMAITFWKNPPTSNWLSESLGAASFYKILQVATSWVAINAVLWLWLILQRVLYCCVWTYWSYESEYRDISYQWWQRVWSSYYPTPLQPPVMSAGFISWIISMSIAVIALSCSLSTNRVWNFIEEFFSVLSNAYVVLKCYANSFSKRIQEILLTCEKNGPIDDSEASSICDDCRSEISSDANNQPQKEVHPISYGTNWMPKPSFSSYKEPQRKVSMKSLHTIAVVNDVQDPDKLSPRQLRQKRGCHTVIPSNSSDKSSEY